MGCLTNSLWSRRECFALPEIEFPTADANSSFPRNLLRQKALEAERDLYRA